MTTESLHTGESLPYKPLAEAIFELRWALDDKKIQGLSVDPGFRLLVGRYYDQVKTDYPSVLDLPAAQIPEELAGYTVRQQFRASKDGWPVTQLGPGLVTVNETTDYSWSTFKPRLMKVISAVFESYPTEIAKFTPNEVMLRYLNAIPLNSTGGEMTILGFLKEYLHIGISVEPTLFENAKLAESPIGLNFNAVYRITKPLGVITISIGIGEQNKVPSLIWELNVRSKGEHVPKEPQSFEPWITEAHRVIEEWFFTLCRGNLLEQFRGK